ncbi:MAG TPA: DUF4082 domain-containing protein [Chitinophagales bacterium]|nr:DUF4082 domain-containing protein [Chitinophagales bacterium]HNM32754.1 DUF4082 domain-containing protein [Chitinophagales bacterium]
MNKNMNFISIFFILFLVMTTQLSCKKDKSVTPTQTEVKPIQNTELRTTYYNRTLNNGYTTSYEHGITFSSNAKGKITKVGGKVPKAGNYRITVWNDSSKAVLATTYADLDSLSYKYVSITPISVPANKRFVVSINVLKDAFEIRDNSVYDFMPFYADGITIHYYSDAKTASQTFPDRFTYTYKIAGLVDFVFVAD